MPGYARNPNAIADDVLVFPDEATRAISLPYPMPSANDRRRNTHTRWSGDSDCFQ